MSKFLAVTFEFWELNSDIPLIYKLKFNICHILIIIFYLGLDFALLQKVRSEIVHRENAGDEEEYEEEIKGGLISEDRFTLVLFDISF